MSYFDQTENTHIDASRALAVTPMIADIIAIQHLYHGFAVINPVTPCTATRATWAATSANSFGR